MFNQYKILTIVYDLDVGGTQRAAQNFAVAYKKNGHDSRVLTVYKGGLRQQELEMEKVLVYLGGETLDINLKQILEWHPQIVHIHRSGETDKKLSEILKILKQKKVKVVETNVFSKVDNSDDWKLIDLHFHLSRWCYWKWKLFLKVPSRGTIVPYLVLPNNFYKETKDIKNLAIEKFKLPKDKFIFGRIGQKSPAKFHPNLIYSFDELYKKRNDIHLFMIGLPDIYLNELKQLKSYRENAITLVDSVVGDENLRLAYNSMDTMIHYSSIGESFGMVLAEAQLCEIPIITVSTPKADNSQLEVLEHESSAFVLKNDKSMIEAMDNFASRKYQLERMGNKGRDLILQRFTPEVLVPLLNEIFSGLLEINSKLNTNIPNDEDFKKLQKVGYGEYSLGTKLFLWSPQLYLRMAVAFGVARKTLRMK